MNSSSKTSTGVLNSPWGSWTPIVLAFIAVALGSRIPLPGLDTSALAEQISYSSDRAMARFSIFALGVIPIFTVLAYAEIAKLAVPTLLKWPESPSHHAHGMSLAVKVLILILTAVQGYGILRVLVSMGLMDGSASVMVAGIASFIGASAVMIWLADIVRLPGARNGVWFLLAIPMLGALPHEVVTLVELIRSGAMSVLESLIICVSIPIAIAMIVLAYKLLSRTNGHGEAHLPLASEVLLWPPFLANIIGGYLIAVPFVLTPELLSNVPWLLGAVAIVLTTLLIPLFVYAYYRLLPSNQSDAARRSDAKSILLAVAGIQVLVCLGIGVLNRILTLPAIPDGGTLIVCVVVMLALRNTLGRGRAVRETGSAFRD